MGPLAMDQELAGTTLIGEVELVIKECHLPNKERIGPSRSRLTLNLDRRGDPNDMGLKRFDCPVLVSGFNLHVIRARIVESEAINLTGIIASEDINRTSCCDSRYVSVDQQSGTS